MDIGVDIYVEDILCGLILLESIFFRWGEELMIGENFSFKTVIC